MLNKHTPSKKKVLRANHAIFRKTLFQKNRQLNLWKSIRNIRIFVEFLNWIVEASGNTCYYQTLCPNFFLIYLLIKTIWQSHQSSFVCAMTGRFVRFLVAITCVRVLLYGLWKCFHFVRLSGWLLLVGGVYHYFSYKCFLSYFFHVTHFQFVLWSARAFKFSYFLIKKLFSLTCL